MDNRTYCSNLDLLKIHHPDLYKRVSSLPEEDRKYNPSDSRRSDRGPLEVVMAKSGCPTLRATADGERQVYLHSSYDPMAEARRLLGDNDYDQMSYILVLGLGLGYHLKELFEQGGETATILVVEDSLTIFRLALKTIDLEKILSSDRIILSIGESPEEVYAKWNLAFQFTGVKGIEIIELPSLVKLNPDYYRRVKELIAANVKLKYSNTATVMNLSHSWQNNTLTNIREIIGATPVKDLFGTFTDVPAIIVASGPSLDRNAPTLKEAVGKAIIVALGSALKPLLAQGVKPDLVVAIDASATNYEHFVGAATDDICLLAEPMVHPRVISEFRGKIFMTSFDNPIMKWLKPYLGDMGSSQMGGTVAVTALDMVRKFGCHPIILTGQDLSFPGGKTHARGSSWDMAALDNSNKFYSLETMHHDHIRRNVSSRRDIITELDLYGNSVATHRNLVVYRELLEAYATYTCRPEEIIINCTEGGLRIEGLKDMPLGKAIEEFCKDPIDSEGFFPRSSSPRPEADLDRLNTAMEELIVGFRETEKVCLRGTEISRRLIDILQRDDKSDGLVDELMGEMDCLDQEIKSRGEAVEILEEITQKVLFRVMRDLKLSTHLEGQDKGMEALRQSHELYLGIGEACGEMRRPFERALAKIRGI